VKTRIAVLAAALVAVLAVAVSASARPQAGGTIVDVAAGNPSFSTLVSLVQSAGLAGALSNANAKLTVFAPTNDAFTKLEAAVPGVTKALTDPANKPLLEQVLKHHVLGSEIKSPAAVDAARAGSKVPTLLGGDANGQLALALSGSSIQITDSAGFSKAIVTTADVAASNGVIHVIDTVLVPKSLVSALQKAGLVKGPSIVEVAAGNKNFSTLVSLVQAAGLVGALGSPDAQLTVFAPRNYAFAALEKAVPGVTAALTDPKNKKLLVQVLQYHVLGSKVVAADAIAAAEQGSKVPTLLGKNANGQIALSIKGGKLQLADSAGLNRAIVRRADIAASNGVVHAIDKVIVPKSVADALKKAGLLG